MHKVKEFLICMGASLGSLFSIIAIIIGLVIHAWTVVIAYSYGGIIAAIISLGFPVFAQIFWVIWIGIRSGVFFNFYYLSIIGYALFWAFICFLFVISEILERIDMEERGTV